MKLRRKLRQKRNHGGKWAALIVVLALAVVGFGLFQGVSGIVNKWLEDLPSVDNTEAFEYSEKTRLYANDGTTLLAEFYLQDQRPVTIDQVSEYVLKGTVATEDERFYDHAGVDFMGIARALVNNMMGGELEGASTITQQLVRNTLLADEATEISLERKVREAELALEMEKRYEKDEILMMYINTINYGDGCYGIEAAAQHYFQKPATDLTINEAATLIGIPQSPTYNNPVLFPENGLNRRNTVLDRMLRNGVITQEEHDAVKEEPIPLNVAPKKSEDGIYLYPYFTSYVRQQLLDTLSFEEVFEGGLTVITTIDPTLQGYAESAAAGEYSRMASSGNSDVLLGMTCIDPKTGYIKAMIGGRDYENSEFNVATSANGRMAGSSFKMFTLTAAIEQGINPETLVDCTSSFSYTAPNGTVWAPNNYDNADYGIRSLASATHVSSNTGFAYLVTDPDGVSPQSIAEMAKRMGDIEVDANQVVPALTLGIAGVNTTEMASAYATLAANGMHYKASSIISVTDSDGAVIYDNSNPQGEQVISHEVAYAVTRVLMGVVTQGTATEAGLYWQVSAGKTGTSEKWQDLWYCGYTPQLSCAVWTGADPQRQMYEYDWCKHMWRTFMTNALQHYETESFATANNPVYDSPFNTKQKKLLTKKAVEEAKKALQGLGDEKEYDAIKGLFNSDYIKIEEKHEFSATVKEGHVISIEWKNEDPDKGDVIVVITISKGHDPASTITANVVGMSESAAVKALTDAGFGAPSVSQEYSATVPAGTVISQSATSGHPKDVISIVVSKGPEPVTPPPVTPDPPEGGGEGEGEGGGSGSDTNPPTDPGTPVTVSEPDPGQNSGN
ncbi:MAG: transglycosylase domain-containing protein [Eggerthellaceae bacterium]|nr:transglycosylase domain-containing protein [Eggerthellaceae bacterium]